MNFNIEDQPYKCSNRLAGCSMLVISRASSDALAHTKNFPVNLFKNYQY